MINIVLNLKKKKIKIRKTRRQLLCRVQKEKAKNKNIKGVALEKKGNKSERKLIVILKS